MIVVDTSAWVELLRGTGSRIHRTLQRLLDGREEPAVTEVVVMELLSGARSRAHAEELRNALLAFRVLRLNGLAGYESAADLYRACLAAGETVRHPDCLIAVPAIEAGVPVLAADRDFEKLARHTSLRLAPLDEG